MKVITVTLNPSLDHTMVVHRLASGYINYTALPTKLDAAGRGVNVARALHALNTDVEAIVLLGNDATGKAYRSLIEQEPFQKHLITVSGQTRSSVILMDTATHTETTVIGDNAGFDIHEVRQVVDLVERLIEPGDFVVYGGPLPHDVPDTIYAEMIGRAQAAGAQVVLDIPNRALREAIKSNPRVIFMTQQQVERYFNFPVRQTEDIVYCANKLVAEGADRVLILLKDYHGILLATAEAVYRVALPERKAGTRSGIVGAMLAGYLAARVKERSVDRALCLGAAAAMYAMEKIGNRFVSIHEIKQYWKAVEVIELEKTPTSVAHLN